MKAVILAAGRGSRMKGMTDFAPKGMTVFQGQPLLAWQIAALRAGGCAEICIVTGYKRDVIAFDGVDTVHNPQWASTNMVASLFCARDWIGNDPFLMSYSDIFYSPETVAAVITAPHDVAVAYDKDGFALWSRRFNNPLSDAETFKISTDDRILEIGQKPQHAGDIEGQYMGLTGFSADGWRSIVDWAKAQEIEALNKMDMTTLLSALIAQGHALHAVSSDGGWGEVDTQDDLVLYETMVTEGHFAYLTDLKGAM